MSGREYSSVARLGQPAVTVTVNKLEPGEWLKSRAGVRDGARCPGVPGAADWSLSLPFYR